MCTEYIPQRDGSGHQGDVAASFPLRCGGKIYIVQYTLLERGQHQLLFADENDKDATMDAALDYSFTIFIIFCKYHLISVITFLFLDFCFGKIWQNTEQ